MSICVWLHMDSPAHLSIYMCSTMTERATKLLSCIYLQGSKPDTMVGAKGMYILDIGYSARMMLSLSYM
jgi:hypothetical protein